MSSRHKIGMDGSISRARERMCEEKERERERRVSEEKEREREREYRQKNEDRNWMPHYNFYQFKGT